MAESGRLLFNIKPIGMIAKKGEVRRALPFFVSSSRHGRIHCISRGVMLKGTATSGWRVQGMTCIFCQIIARRLPAEFLHEDEDLVVIKDINPAAPIHVLIIPKKHIDSMNSLDPALAQIFPKMMLLAKEMAEKLGTKTGYRLVINCGREAGQVIFHLHMHLMGGYGREMGRR